jgi:hypothetical protein
MTEPPAKRLNLASILEADDKSRQYAIDLKRQEHKDREERRAKEHQKHVDSMTERISAYIEEQSKKFMFQIDKLGVVCVLRCQDCSHSAFEHARQSYLYICDSKISDLDRVCTDALQKVVSELNSQGVTDNIVKMETRMTHKCEGNCKTLFFVHRLSRAC